MKLTVNYISSIFVSPSKIPIDTNTSKNRITIEKKKTFTNSLESAFQKLSSTQALLKIKMRLKRKPQIIATAGSTVKKRGEISASMSGTMLNFTSFFIIFFCVVTPVILGNFKYQNKEQNNTSNSS